jgi:glycosyltransferase involved in cell wall biosynthesis
MKITVVIPTRNRADLLKSTLSSLLNQTLPSSEFEVIVVDNGSTDNTSQVAESFSSQIQVRCIHEPRPGLHRGRHAGWLASKTDYIVYADDDIEAFPTWLQTIVDVFDSNEKIAMVGGKNLPKFQSTPPFWITEMWNKPHPLGKMMADLSILDFGNNAMEFHPMYIFGCNFSVRKSILDKTKGFHPDGMPFDMIEYRGDGETFVAEWVNSNGYLAYYHPGASVYHVVTNERLTREYFFKRRYTQGISDAYTALRSGEKTKSPIQGGLKYKLKILLGIEQIKLLAEIKKELSQTEFDKQLKLSYQNGFNFLTGNYKNRPEIKEWIHKENYIE